MAGEFEKIPPTCRRSRGGARSDLRPPILRQGGNQARTTAMLWNSCGTLPHPWSNAMRRRAPGRLAQKSGNRARLDYWRMKSSRLTPRGAGPRSHALSGGGAGSRGASPRVTPSARCPDRPLKKSLEQEAGWRRRSPATRPSSPTHFRDDYSRHFRDGRTVSTLPRTCWPQSGRRKLSARNASSSTRSSRAGVPVREQAIAIHEG